MTPLSSNLFELQSLAPDVHESAWIAPTAAVIGDVRIGAGSGIWFHCVLRGDTNSIRIGARTNVQDGTIIHVDPGEMATIIGDDVTIGHGCIIHGCKLMGRAFVGMGATILNGAVVEPEGMLAAGALLTSAKRVATGELWAGAPAKFLRLLSSEEREEFKRGSAHYVNNAARFKSSLRWQ